jgi:hypothetical protein
MTECFSAMHLVYGLADLLTDEEMRGTAHRKLVVASRTRGTQATAPSALAFDANGSLFVANFGSNPSVS